MRAKTNHRWMAVSYIIFLVGCIMMPVKAETADGPPHYYEMCRNADVVLLAQLAENEPASYSHYNGEWCADYIFNTVKLYKGVVTSKYVKVIAAEQATGTDLCSVADFTKTSVFKPGEKYILFLSVFRDRYENLAEYRRCERLEQVEPCSASLEAKILNILNEIKTVRAPQGIPADAKSREAEPFGNFKKICRYYDGESFVGERGWYSEERTAYEKPMRDGMLHGLEKQWTEDGQLYALRWYRFNELHGPSMTIVNGVITVKYFIDGSQVVRKRYLEVAQTNKTLPELVDAPY